MGSLSMTFDEFYFVALSYIGKHAEQRKGQALVNILRRERKDLLDKYYNEKVWTDTAEGVKDPFFKDYLFGFLLDFVEKHWN